MIRRERQVNVILLLCAPTSAHFLHVQKYERFSTCKYRHQKERQTSASPTLGTSRAHALNSLCFRGVLVDRGLSQSDINDAQSTHDKIKKNF